MIIFLSILSGIIFYIVGAGITYGYSEHRWPSAVHDNYSMDDGDIRALAAWLWPFYWIFIWPFTKSKEVTFSRIEKHAAQQVTKNKTRISDLHVTREQVEATNKELEQAEADLEKEITTTL